jgi:hypothetical protein
VWLFSTNYQFSRCDNQPIEPWSNYVIEEKNRYIHINPVDERLVYHTKNYVNSSAKGYSGEKGISDGIIVLGENAK